MRLIIDGLGEVSETWKQRRIKDIGTLVLGKMLQEMPVRGYVLKKYLKSKNVGWLTGNLEDVAEMYFSATEMTTLRLKKGDLIFAEGGDVGKTFIWEDGIDDCYIQNSVQKLTLKDGFIPRYYLYVSFTLGQNGYYRAIVNHVSIMHLTREKLQRVAVPVPPLETQRRIVSYLDEKTAAIDERVAVLEKKLAAYKRLKTSVISRAVTRGLDPKAKLKDSGVDWIGKVPAGWEVTHLKRLTKKIGSGKTPSGGAEIYGTEGVMFLRSQNVYDEGLSLDDVAFISSEIDAEMASTRVVKGDVLLNITGGSIGRCCVYERSESANVNQHVCIIRADTKLSHDAYIKYFWNSLGQEYMRLSQLGGNRESLNFEQIGNAPFPCPPFPEQRAIADYLDAECAKIDNMAALVTREIELYKNLKRSLINEVVTGKREVA